jgi:hypothetical protein
MPKDAKALLAEAREYVFQQRSKFKQDKVFFSTPPGELLLEIDACLGRPALYEQPKKVVPAPAPEPKKAVAAVNEGLFVKEGADADAE